MTEIKSEPKRGLSNYWIELVGMDSLHRSGAAIMHFKISVRDGTKEFSSTTIPITVDGGEGSLDATAGTGSGAPKTAASRTSGWLSSALSISIGEIMDAPRIMTSLAGVTPHSPCAGSSEILLTTV
jgi:hypothetical protein